MLGCTCFRLRVFRFWMFQFVARVLACGCMMQGSWVFEAQGLGLTFFGRTWEFRTGSQDHVHSKPQTLNPKP